MFNLTPAAAQQIQQAAQASGAAELALRVAAKKDAAGDMQYGMGFDEQREHDMLIHCEGVAVLVSPGSTSLLKGVTLDFVEFNPGEFQFIFIPPDAGGGPGE